MKWKLGIVAIAVIGVAAGNVLAAPTPEGLYQQGQVAYDHGDFQGAILKWEAAYKLSGATGLLYNLAQAYRLGGDCHSALSTYRHFVAADPAAVKRPVADDWTTAVAVVPSPPSPAPGRHKLNLVALGTAGAGVVLFGIGLVIGHRASQLAGDVTYACEMSCSWAVEKSVDAAGHRDAAIGWTFDGVGLAAIATGAGLYLYERRSHREVPAVAIQPQAAGATISWSGRW
jgi:hypothetical protein